MLRPFASASCPPAPAVGSGSSNRRARPWMIESPRRRGRRRAAGRGRRRPTGHGSRAARAGDGGGRADLLEADRPRPLLGLGPGVAQHHGGGRHDLQLVGLPPVAGQAALDVVRRRPAPPRSVEWRLKMTSAVAAASSRPPSESPAWMTTGWTCGLRGTLNRPCDVELLAVVGERARRRRRRRNAAGAGVGHHVVVGPRRPTARGPPRPSRRPARSAAPGRGSRPPEVLAGEGVRAR